MSLATNIPSPEAIQAILDIILPGASYLNIHSLEGNFSNSTHLVNVRAYDGSLFQIVVRRYAIFGSYDQGEKARREFKTLQLLKSHGFPVPEPLYLDDAGAFLGSPGIVTRYVPGRLVLAYPYPPGWAEIVAKTLAHIHTIPIDVPHTPFLLDANREVLWFLESQDAIPDYIRAHPKGMAVWEAVLEYLPKLIKVKPSLVHIDYWSGNILWANGAISAVVDWEEAAQGDPGIDVAYCRMDMILSGMNEAADQFLKTYEAAVNKPTANLGFWELAAAVRPMFSPDGWISEPPARERFADYVDAAIQKTRL